MCARSELGSNLGLGFPGISNRFGGLGVGPKPRQNRDSEIEKNTFRKYDVFALKPAGGANQQLLEPLQGHPFADSVHI